MIEAAGGVVWRVSGKGHVKVLLVHRPQYGDWSLPKGKVEQGEDPLTAALREVREETGLRCEVGIELPEVRYHDHKGRPKCVRYWAMRPGGGRFHRNHEVDRVRWVTVEEAASVMSYGHDVTVVAALADRLALTV